jgi:5-formyltetrahydrofolate cyclo-ligase
VDVREEKRKLREQIWGKMEGSGIARFPLPCRGRIPNFMGAEKAAELLRGLIEYQNAKIVFVNPDSPQFYVRRQALLDGKTVVMASPRLKAGFIVLKPEVLKGFENEVSTIRGAFKHGQLVEEIPKVDLVIEGSVAVDMHGNRLGKGGGYGDKEISMVKEKCGRDVKVVTTVHSMQIVPLAPRERGDEKVDIIVTEKSVHRV